MRNVIHKVSFAAFVFSSVYLAMWSGGRIWSSGRGEELSGGRGEERPGNYVEWLSVDRASCMLGTVSPGDDIAASVGICNVTAHELRIVETSPGCGCLSVSARNTVLKPKESTFLDCELRAKDRLGDMGVAIAVIMESEPTGRNLQPVLLSAKITPVGQIAWSPEVLNFGTIRGHETVKRFARLTVEPELASSVGDLEIIESPPGVEIKLEFSGCEGRLEVALDTTRSASLGSGHVKIRSTKESSIFVDVPLSWRLKSSVRATPSCVIVTPKAGEYSGTIDVALSCEEGVGFEVVKAAVAKSSKTKDRGILVTVKVDESSTMQLDWEIQSKSTSGFAGTLEVDIRRVGDDGTETLFVPVIISQ